MTRNQLAILDEMNLLAYPSQILPQQNEIAIWRFLDSLDGHAATRMIRALRIENENLRKSLLMYEAALQTAMAVISGETTEE